MTARPGDLDTISGLVARAFHDLPPARWLIGNETIRRRTGALECAPCR